MILASDLEWTQIVFLLGGVAGIVGGALAAVRFIRRASSGTFTIEAAKGVTLMQNTFIETLQENYDRVAGDYDKVLKENQEMRIRLNSLEDQVRSFGRMHERIQDLERENAELKDANATLQARVEHLEDEIKQVNGG